MAPVLIVGATRGLGAELTKQYAKQGKTVYGTARSEAAPKDFPESVKWLPNVDLTKKDVGDTVVSLLGGSQPLESVVRLPCSPQLCIIEADHSLPSRRSSRQATSRRRISTTRVRTGTRR